MMVDGHPCKPHGAAVQMFSLLLDSITLEATNRDRCVKLEERATAIWEAAPEWLRVDIHRTADRLLTYAVKPQP